jgi:hypothetical protein
MKNKIKITKIKIKYVISRAFTDCPKNFKEFRPISLCNTIYKLITKILVNRLRPFLNQIVCPFQSSFLPGKGTTDNAIILQEAIHSTTKSITPQLKYLEYLVETYIKGSEYK